MGKSSYNDAVIAVTYQCNSRCRMCKIWEKKDNFFSLQLEDFKRLPESLRYVNLSGGEPFLRSDITDIVKIIKERCKKSNIIISSNGFATDVIISSMKKILEVDSSVGVAISIDGIGDEHDKIRGIKGGYERVSDTIKKLKFIGVKNLKIAFTIGDYNFNELKNVYSFSKRMGIEFTLSLVHGSENFFNTKNTIGMKEEIVTALDWLKTEELKTWNLKKWVRAYYIHGMQYFIKNGKRIIPDYSGIKNIFIDPYGNIFPCDISSEKIGSLNNIENAKHLKSIDCGNSWMICTAREAIKKHWFKVVLWILRNKILLIIQNRVFINHHENTGNK